jgi:hypothetical protein
MGNILLISCLVPRLEIKQGPDGVQDVPGLVDAPIYTIDGVWEKLKVGARNRSVGSTNVNELSSRSHRSVSWSFMTLMIFPLLVHIVIQSS